METAPPRRVHAPRLPPRRPGRKPPTSSCCSSSRHNRLPRQRVNDQQVQRAQQQLDSRQNEVRIQDAPGPAQTGVVPAAGAPVAPVNADTRIQDAPGPAQTLPSAAVRLAEPAAFAAPSVPVQQPQPPPQL